MLEVGTKERLSIDSARVPRVYPIDDILYEPAKITGSPSVGIINPGSLDGYGGYGGYGANGFGGRAWHGGFGRFGGYGSANTTYGGSLAPAPLRQSSQQKTDKAQQIMDLIMDVIEPEAWIENGGEWASIHYQEGALVVTAPDFVHRQINGYPPVPRPTGRAADAPTSHATGH